MAARTVRCFLSNQTDRALVFASDSYQHGIITDPWYPPPVIEPGAIGQWRAESDGFMTGTEGSVRYSTAVADASDDHIEIVEVHWDNPFIGGNNASASAKLDFSGAPSSALKVAWYIQANGAPPPNAVKMAGGDVEAWIDAVLFPPYVLANWNTASFNDANAFFAVRAGQQPQSFGGFDLPTGPRTQRLNTKTNPAQWAGRWMSPQVCVTLVQRNGRGMTAFVTDRSTEPALQFQQDFELGALSMWSEHQILYAIDAQSSASDTVKSAFRAASARVAASASSQDQVASTELFRRTALEKVEANGSSIHKEQLDRTAKAIASFVKHRDATVVLGNGVHLTLYDEFTGGKHTGGYLQYERHNAFGQVAKRERLEYVVDLH